MIGVQSFFPHFGQGKDAFLGVLEDTCIVLHDRLQHPRPFFELMIPDELNCSIKRYQNDILAFHMPFLLFHCITNFDLIFVSLVEVDMTL
jgi:hypothetical protein